MSLRRAAAVAALCVAGCTLDYDAILDAAEEAAASGASSGGGGEDPAASNASSSTSAASTSTIASSASAASSGAGGGGTGGEANGGGAGEGGSGGSGEGGAGGGVVDLGACAATGLDFSEGTLDRALHGEWQKAGNQTLEVDGELDVVVGPGQATGIKTIQPVLFECRMRVTMRDLEPFGDAGSEVPVAVGFGTVDGEITIITGDDGEGYCILGAGGVDGGDCLDSQGDMELGLVHTGTQLCFEAAFEGEEPQPVGVCVPSTMPRQVVLALNGSTQASVSFDDIR